MLSEAKYSVIDIIIVIEKVYNLLYIKVGVFSQYLITGRLDDSYYNLVLNLS